MNSDPHDDAPAKLLGRQDPAARTSAPHDITTEKRVEGERDEVQKRLQALFDHAQDAIVMADENARFQDANQAACALTGYTRDELLARHVWQLFSPEDEDEARRSWDHLLASGRMAGEFPLRRKDGSQVQVEFRAVADMLPGLHLSILRDVSERKAAEASLRKSEMRFRSLTESTVVGVFFGEGENFLIREANDAFLQLIGATHGELKSSPIDLRDITPPEYHAVDAHAIAACLEAASFSPYRKEFLRRDDTRVPVLQAPTCLDRARGEWACMVIDLTERERLEERLRHSQKLESIGLLAGGVAHDFNNLLTGVLGNASLALDLLEGAHPVRPMLEEVVRGSQRASDLTRQLLAYAGRGRIHVQPLDLSALVREITSLVQTSVPRKVRLRFELAPGLSAVEADPGQIEQLVMNMVINAAEAIGDRMGEVLITTGLRELDDVQLRDYVTSEHAAPGTFVALEVHDTGEGMDEATRARIFDPFFTTKFLGRGLGLAAALGIVRGHRGAIRVSSVPGRGSTFTVLLPLGEKPAAARSEAKPHAELSGSGTVLVVDDEEAVRELAGAALRRWGYVPILTANGYDALEVFRQRSGEISVVLLDIAMPVMGGDEVLARMRSIRSDLRVIVSSGYSLTGPLEALMEQGGISFLQKPYVAADLGAKLKEALNPAV